MPAGAVSLIRDVFVGEGGLQNTPARREPPDRAGRAGAASCEFDFDFLDLFEVKAREYREEDLVFTRPHAAPASASTCPTTRTRTPGRSGSATACFSAEALVWVSQRRHAERALHLPQRSRCSRERPGSRARTWCCCTATSRRRDRYTTFYFGQERVRVEESLRAWRLHAPELVTDWEELRNTYTPLAGRPGRAAHARPPGRDRMRRPAGRRAAVVHDRVRPRHADHQLPDAAAGPVAGGGHAGGAGRAAGGRARRRARRRARQDRARAAGGPGRGRGRRLPLLRQRRLDPAVPDPAVRAVPLDRRRRHGQAACASRPCGRWAGCARRATWTATATSSTTAGRSAAWSPRPGRTRGTRCATATAASRARRSPPPRCRATPTTPACARPSWPPRVGRRRSWRRGSSARPAQLKHRFNQDFFSERDGDGYFVLGLDHEKRQIDSLCSNIGHLLWSGHRR